MITAEQLQPFCANPDEQPTRPVLHKPYVLNGRTYATDGNIIVRVPYAVPGVKRSAGAPSGDGVIDPLPTTGLWFKPPLPNGIGRDKACPTCHGEGGKACPACKGDGEVEWTFRHYMRQDTCPMCDGGGTGCNTCDGTWQVPDDTPVKMGLNWFQAHYLRMVMDLPDAELCGGDVNEPARFRFDGGDGALMPLDVATWNDRCRARGEPERMIAALEGDAR